MSRPSPRQAGLPASCFVILFQHPAGPRHLFHFIPWPAAWPRHAFLFHSVFPKGDNQLADEHFLAQLPWSGWAEGRDMFFILFLAGPGRDMFFILSTNCLRSEISNETTFASFVYFDSQNRLPQKRDASGIPEFMFHLSCFHFQLSHESPSYFSPVPARADCVRLPFQGFHGCKQDAYGIPKSIYIFHVVTFNVHTSQPQIFPLSISSRWSHC